MTKEGTPISDEQRLRDALSGLVPEPPTAPGRASAARAHAARARRGRIAAGTGAALVAAAIVVPFALTRGGDTRTTPQPATSSTPAVVAGDFACPDSPGPRKMLNPDPGAATLAPGAIGVRLCHPGGFPWQPPADALTHDVGSLISAINDLPPSTSNGVCTLEDGLTWAMSFQYAEGHTRLIEGVTYSCGGVQLGTHSRGSAGDASRVLDQFREALSLQRKDQQPPVVAVVGMDLQCNQPNPEWGPGGSLMGLGDPVELSRAVLCWRHETESDLPSSEAPISSADLQVLLDDLNHRRPGPEVTEQECVGPDVIHYRILGVNAWGDRLSLDGYCGAFDLSGSNSDVWRPAPETQAIFARLVSAQPLEIPSPTADTAPDGVLQAWVDLLNNGLAERADQLWVDPAIADRPGDDIDHLQMKTEEVRPTTAEGYAQARIAMALYREVPKDGSWVDFHERAFTLVRNSSDEPWRILSYVDQGAVQTGR